jgi:hypothetical protein
MNADSILVAVTSFTSHYPILVTLGGMAITGMIGWMIPNDKAVAAGRWVSQLVRKIGGKGLEQKIEGLADSFEKGMKEDNEGK